MIVIKGTIRAKLDGVTREEKDMSLDKVDLEFTWDLFSRQVGKETIRVSSQFERTVDGKNRVVTLNAEDVRNYMKTIDAVRTIYAKGEQPDEYYSGYDQW